MIINAATYMPEMIKNYETLSKGEARFVNGIGSDIKKEGVVELAYTKTPVKSMSDIITLTENVRNNVEKITAPALIIKSQDDHVVPPENSNEIYRSISSGDSKLLELENSYHVATLDNDKEVITKECIAFIRSRV